MHSVWVIGHEHIFLGVTIQSTIPQILMKILYSQWFSNADLVPAFQSLLCVLMGKGSSLILSSDKSS